MKRVLPITLVLIAAAVAASAQSVYTPDKGSPERKAILDALRVPVERDLKQKIVFISEKFNIQGTWAFLSGRPTKPDGSDPDLKNTAWDGAEDAFDHNYFALLKKTGGKWKVVKYAIGCTDVCYGEWWKEARAPKTIFDMTY